jgi:Ca2+-binding RTX toxin-like protein
LSNIENISVTNYQVTDAHDNTINLAQATGISKISLAASASTGDTFFTQVRAIATAEMGNGAGDLGITYTDTAVAGAADSQTLTLSGQTAGSFFVKGATTGGVETLNIASTTATNAIAIEDAVTATIATINVTGDQQLTLTEGATDADDAVTVINASALTGKLLVTTGSAAQYMSITGGTANDTITFSGDTFTSADTVNGGSGTDTLSIASSVASATALQYVTNVEVLKVTGAHDVTLAANVVPTSFDFTSTSNNVLTLNSGYTSATTVTLESGDKVDNSSANVTLTVNMSGADLVTGTTITGGTGTDTINLTADSTASLSTNFDNITSVNAITIVDGGDAATGTSAKGKDVALNLGNYATSITIDGSALDAGTVTNSVMGADDETLTVDGSSIATATVVLTATGGAGRDTLTGGAGNDILNGNGGNDSINGATGGADSILGGDGNDTINMGAQLTSADTINGGSGTDTLIVTSLTSTGLTNVTNVENLQLSGSGSNATLTSNLSFTTIDIATADNAAQSVTFSTGYTNATTVVVDTGDTVTNSANIAMTVTAAGSDLASTTITGGTGTDSINLTADSATVTFASLITKVDSITIVDGGDDAAAGTHPAGQDITLTLGDYATSLTVDGSALDAGTVNASNVMQADYENLSVDGSSVSTATVVLNLTGGAGADTLKGGAGNDIINGGAGNDSIVGSAGGADSILAGSGTDTIVMVAALTYADTVDGGAGNDTISADAGVTDVAFMHVSNVETLTLNDAAATTTLSSYFNTSGIATVNLAAAGTARTVDATGTTNGITYVIAQAANESVDAGQGNDTFKVSGTTYLTAADELHGGSGTDTLLLDNSGGAVTGTVDLFKVTSVEQFTVLNANGGDTAGAENADAVSLTINATDNSTDNTDVTFTVSGSVITDANDSFTVDASGSTDTDYFFSITGGAGNDTLTGGAKADTIAGGSGNDSLVGGLGADSLTGGTGNDVFRIATATAASTNAAYDTISDFATGSDTVRITVATGVGATWDLTNKGSSASNSDAMSLLSSVKGQYYFNTATNQVVLDLDGNGLLQSSDVAVKLASVTSLAGADVAFDVTATTGGNAVVTLGSGADTVDITGTGNMTVTMGAGNDTVSADTSTLDASDSIYGGSGTDTLNIATAGTATLTTDANLTGIENITFTSNSIVLDLTGQTEAFNVTTANGTNSITVNATVADTLTGGTGADTFIIGTVNAHAFLAQATIAGGSGSSDQITLGLATTTLVDADFAHVTGVELLQLKGVSTIVLGSNAQTDGLTTVLQENAAAANTTITSTSTVFDTVTGANSGTINVTFGDIADNTGSVSAGTGNVTVAGGSSGDTITVTGLATAAQTFTGSAAKFNVTATTNAQTITTGAYADTIDGGAGADTIDGGASSDTITGGAGNDSLTGGTGSDTFVYTTASDSNGVTAAAIDTITDLVLNGASGDLLDFTMTGTLTVATSASGAANFAAADTTAELTGLFNSTNGTAGTKFTGGANATALLVTNTDSSKMLVVDVDGDGAFTVADVAILITGVTATSFTTACFV